MQNEKRAAELCQELILAKMREADATRKRVEIQQEIIDIVGCPQEGTETHDVDGYKVKIEQRIIRKLDDKAWAMIADQIPESLWPVTVKEEYAITSKGVRWLMENEPGYYKLLCSAMEEKPANPSVKVEVKQ